MWHQSTLVLITYLLVLPFLTLLSLWYPTYGPLLFFYIRVSQIDLAMYYTFLVSMLFMPLLVFFMFAMMVLGTQAELSRQQVDVIASIKKSLSILPYVVGSLWSWTGAWWLWMLFVKLFTSFFGRYALEDMGQWIGYGVFYAVALEFTRSSTFALHYYFFQGLSWQAALAQSCLLTKQYGYYIRSCDILLTILPIMVPVMVWTFGFLVERAVPSLLAGSWVKLLLLFFMWFAFATYAVARSLLFVRITGYGKRPVAPWDAMRAS